jgi:hypothetical protein
VRLLLAAATVALWLGAAAPAGAMTFRGSAVEDPQMSVRLQLGADGTVAFEYAKVMVECSNGERLRQPGAEHLATRGPRGRFRDEISEAVEGGNATSSARGRVGKRKAKGTVSFELSYEGGECHSGPVRWKARRKRAGGTATA